VSIATCRYRYRGVASISMRVFGTRFLYQSRQVYIGPNTRPALSSDRIIFFAQFYNTAPSGYLCTALRAPKSLIIESQVTTLYQARRLEVITVSVARPSRSVAFARDVLEPRELNHPVSMTNFTRSPLPRR